jgi:nicotinate-nucleotide adenylyltransferase
LDWTPIADSCEAIPVPVYSQAEILEYSRSEAGMDSTLCFGGSFNPIHNGHIICARAVAKKLDFSHVLLIPSAVPPHKLSDADLAPAADRLGICLSVAADDPLFQASDIEVRRSGPSYTLNTVLELKRQGWTQVNWLIGADMLNYLPKWHEPGHLLKEVNFVVIARPGFEFEWSMLPKEFHKLQEHIVEAPLVDVSATEIRRRVRAGESIDELVPPSVARYIHAHRLYR